MDRFILPLGLVLAFVAGSFAVPVAPASADATQPCAERDGVLVCERPDGYLEYTLPDGLTLLTHGPDPPPPGDHGDDVGAQALRDPACGTQYVQHVLYGHRTGTANRLLSVRGTLQNAIRSMNGQLDTDAFASGGVRADYRVLCNADGTIRVDSFSASATDYGTITGAARAAGFNDPTRDYTIFWDAPLTGICGEANLRRDPSPGAGNDNNQGGGYAVTYQGCWTGRTPMHENGHNMGAVQDLAPDWDGTGHCLEGIDVMCYPTSSFVVLCPARLHFDCSYDTYYDAAPEPGEWLDTHWNIGDPANRFILYGGVRVPDAPVLAGFAGDGQAFLSWNVPSENGRFLTAFKVFRNGALHATLGPSVTGYTDVGLTNGVPYTYAVKATNARGDSAASNALTLTPRSDNLPPTACFAETADWVTVHVDATCASDPDGTSLSYSWAWGDGTAGGSGLTASHLYAQPGAYVVTLTVMDDNGATASVARTVQATLPPDPDPAVPVLSNGQAVSSSSTTMGAEAHYKIFVPSNMPHLRVRLDGPNCMSAMAITIACNPNLDLYVRQGSRPTDGAFTCRSTEIDSDEICMPLRPASGWWFIRVKYALGTGPAPFTVTPTY